jgi:hypothetical protein
MGLIRRPNRNDVTRARAWHALQLGDEGADRDRARFVADCTVTPGPGRLVFGRLLTPQGWQWVGLRTDPASGQHIIVSGGSGTGKTAGTAIPLVIQHLRYHPNDVLLILDKKSELVPLIAEVVLPAFADDPGVIGRIHMIVPHGQEIDGQTYLPHLNITQRDDSLSLEQQTLSIVEALNAAVDLGGLRMNRGISMLVKAVVELEYPLTRLRIWLQMPATFARDAQRSTDPLLRAYAAQFSTVEPAATREALASRLDLILFQRETRLCLSAPRCFNLRNALATPGSIILIDLFDRKSASDRSLIFWSSLLTTWIISVILSRPINEHTPHITWTAEEWQNGLEKEEAHAMEKTSSLARFKRLSLVTINQAFSQISKIDSSLPKLLRTNSTVEIAYRSAPEDASMLTPPILDTKAARAYAQRLICLGRREASLWIKPYGPQLIRSPRIDFDRLRQRAAEVDPAIRHAILRGVDSERQDVLEARLAHEDGGSSAGPVMPSIPDPPPTTDPRYPRLG